MSNKKASVLVVGQTMRKASDLLVGQIMRDEGLVLHEYKDTLGFSTIGYGRLIDKRKGGGITKDEAEYLLFNDINKVIEELKHAIPWHTGLSLPRCAVLINMAFQLGTAGLLGFRRTLKLVEDGLYDEAAIEMLDSKWAKQTPARARRLSKQMETDQWQ